MGDAKRRLDYLMKKSWELGDIIAEHYPDEDIEYPEQVFEVAGKLLLKLKEVVDVNKR